MMLDDKELKQQILNSIDDDCIPNFSTAIKAKHLAKSSKKHIPWYKSRPFWGITGAILTCGIIAGIIVVPLNNIPGSSDTHISKPTQIRGKNNEIAFGVLSASNLIMPNNGDTNLFRNQKLTYDQFYNEVTKLNNYMGTAEAMINSNLDIAPIMVESDDPNYTYLMQINNFGEQLSFYYNDINQVNNSKRLLNDDDEDEDDDDEIDNDDDDSEEQEYSYKGILRRGNDIFPVDVEKEFELGEYELTLKIYNDSFNLDNYISIEEEVENDEQSYAYIFVENGKEMLGAEMSFEIENDETIVEIELFENDSKSAFQVSGTGNNFRVEYEIKGYDQGIIDVDVIANDSEKQYRYREKDLKFEIILKRN